MNLHILFFIFLLLTGAALTLMARNAYLNYHRITYFFPEFFTPVSNDSNHDAKERFYMFNKDPKKIYSETQVIKAGNLLVTAILELAVGIVFFAAAATAV